jgi:CRISPR/Cas system-associated exonuclease Cas4 (RecB family)
MPKQSKFEKPKLSPSTLNLYVDCPRCFWLQLRKGLRRPSGPFPSLPVGMDSVIKKYFETYRGKKELPQILKNKIPGRLALAMPKTLSYEDEAGYTLYGRPDEYVELPGELIAALDHKTRASAPKELLPVYQNQLNIYDFLLGKNKYRTAGKAYLVYYHPAIGELHNGFPFETTVKEIETDPEAAEELFKKAIEVLEQEVMPDSAETCQFCAWAKQVGKL